MNWKTTIVLLILVIGAAGLWYWLRDKPTSRDLQARERYLISRQGRRLRPSEVAVLRIQRGDGAIELARENERWIIRQPATLRADQTVVEKMLAALLNVTRRQRLRPANGGQLDLAKVGLATPHAKIVITPAARDAEPFSLEIGSTVPLTGAVHVRRAGEEAVLVVDGQIAKVAGMALNQLRSTEIVAIGYDELSAVELSYDETRIVCRRGETHWLMEEPLRDLADSAALRSMTSALTDLALRSEDFLLPDAIEPEALGLDRPRLTLVLRNGGRRETVLIGSAVPGRSDLLYVARADEPTAARVRASLLDDLRMPAESLRANRLLLFDREEVAQVRLTGKGSPLQLVKVGQGWRIAAPDSRRADAAVLQAFLEDLQEVRIQRYMDDLDNMQDQVTVTLLDTEQKPIVGVVIGQRGPNGVRYVRRMGFPHVFAVADAPWTWRALAGEYGYVDHQVMHFPLQEATRLAVRQQGREERVYEKRLGRWRLTSPIDAPVDEWAMHAALYELSSLRAVRIVAPAPERAADLTLYGLRRPALRIAVTCRKEAGEPETCTLLVGGPVGEGVPEQAQYAMLRDGPYLFLLPHRSIANLKNELVSQRISEFVTDEVERLRVRSGSLDATWTRDGEDWKAADKEARALGTDAARDILDVISRLDGSGVIAFERDAETLRRTGLAEPILHISVHQRRIQTPKEILIGRGTAPLPSRNRFSAVGPDSSFVLAVSPRQVERLMTAVDLHKTTESDHTNNVP